jgi:hypothetical protein
MKVKKTYVLMTPNKNLLQMPNLISHIISVNLLAMAKSHHIKNVKKYLSSALVGSSVVGKY